ncbi:hypothetical protein ACFY36_15165 [Actinoplanes sp. NPDC000266]
MSDKILNIDAMAYRLKDLGDALPDEQNYRSDYTRTELARMGYRAGVDNMNKVATGQYPMGDESRKNNEIFKTQLTRARVYIDFYKEYYEPERDCGCA